MLRVLRLSEPLFALPNMSVPSSTKLMRVLFHHPAPKVKFAGGAGAFSAVALKYVMLFRGFKVKEWTGFEEKTAKVFVDKPIDAELFHLTKANWARYIPCNDIDPPKEKEWQVYCPPIPGRHRNSKPDFSYCSTTKLYVPGEMKRPNLELGSALKEAELKRDLSRDVDKLVGDKNLRPFFQCFSHIADSETGIRILTNYYESRYFRLNLRDRCIYISPLVKVNQVLNEVEKKLHPLQAMLFAKYFKVPEREFNRKMAEVEVKKWDKNAKKLIEEEEAAKKSGKGGKRIEKKRYADPEAGSSKAVTAVALGLDGPLENVSLVSANCEKLRVLREGASGTVWECKYEGGRVAMKWGLPFNSRYDKIDQFELLNHEIEVYNKLLPLQGKYIPRVVAGGYEPWFTPGGMALITEKVGHELVQDEEEAGVFYVEGKRLNRTEIEEIRESGSEGRLALYAHGTVHGDGDFDNMRVEKRNGRHHVWWIDFGFTHGIIKDDGARGTVRAYVKKFDKALGIERLTD